MRLIMFFLCVRSSSWVRGDLRGWAFIQHQFYCEVSTAITIIAFSFSFRGSTQVVYFFAFYLLVCLLMIVLRPPHTHTHTFICRHQSWDCDPADLFTVRELEWPSKIVCCWPCPFSHYLCQAPVQRDVESKVKLPGQGRLSSNVGMFCVRHFHTKSPIFVHTCWPPILITMTSTGHCSYADRVILH